MRPVPAPVTPGPDAVLASHERPLITFRILGSIEVHAGDRRVALGGPRQLGLVAYLVLNANQTVSAGALIDVLWGAERRSSTTLHVAVARLRKSFASVGEEPLRTVDGGYRLDVGPGGLDAQVFEDGAREGERALARGDAGSASGHLADALGLWRGPALAGVAGQPFAQAEVAAPGRPAAGDARDCASTPTWRSGATVR